MNHNRANGFTLIELMLAMSFIAILLMAIAMTVIQMSNMYTRGLTLKEVNQAGRSLSSELTHSVGVSTPFSVVPGLGQYVNKPYGGRLCLGAYSYIWNYGTTLASVTSTRNKFTPVSTNEIRFVRVPDSTGAYCSASTQDISSVGAVELLDVGDLNLAIHSFTISSQASADNPRTHQRLYYISFVVGTNEQAALDMTSQATCKPPDNTNSNINYCSVNRFDIVARAGNAVQ